MITDPGTETENVIEKGIVRGKGKERGRENGKWKECLGGKKEARAEVKAAVLQSDLTEIG